MPCAYSADLPERVLAACQQRQSRRAAIARQFQVSESTVYHWLKQVRVEGRRQAKPHAGGPAPKVDPEARRVLRELVSNDNDATLDDYCEQWAQRTGCRISRTTMCLVLQDLIWHEKKTIHASEQTREDIVAERDQFRQDIAKMDPDRLVFVDETGIGTQMTRRYGRAPAGQRAQGAVPYGQRHHLTGPGALSRAGGIVAAMSLAAATSTPVFLAFIQQVLLPTLQRLRPDAVVVMDNLSSHKSSVITNAFKVAGITLLFLPRYSPDLSPLEPGWAKVKSILGRKEARSRDQLDQELGPTLDAVTPADAAAWFHHCGLDTPN